MKNVVISSMHPISTSCQGFIPALPQNPSGSNGLSEKWQQRWNFRMGVAGMECLGAAEALLSVWIVQLWVLIVCLTLHEALWTYSVMRKTLFLFLSQALFYPLDCSEGEAFHTPIIQKVQLKPEEICDLTTVSKKLVELGPFFIKQTNWFWF
jgi:hypothetical protein